MYDKIVMYKERVDP